MKLENQLHYRKSATGKPSKVEGQPVNVGVTIKLSKLQKEKLVRLGGAAWIRARIEEAYEPNN